MPLPPVAAPVAAPTVRRPAPASPPASALSWLQADQGILRRPDGQPVRLLGLRLDDAAPLGLHSQADTLLAGVPHGGRCMALQISRTAQLKPAALAQLDACIAGLSMAGCYTLLRLPARLWLHGHHLRLARRYVETPSVLYALSGRAPMAERLWQAAQALQQRHPRALVWLPLESARTALRAGANRIGLLWDATRPQAPASTALAGVLRHPVLLDGWDVEQHSPLAQQRLVALCRQAGLGWLAQSRGGWAGPRPALALRRSIHQSGVNDIGA